MPVQGTFFYDGDCGFCQWSANKLRELTGERLEIRPAWVGRSQPGLPAAVDRGVQERIECEAVYWSLKSEVEKAGHAPALFGGHRAIARVLEECGRRPWIRAIGRVIALPVISPAAGVVYRVIACYRHKLGPLVGEQACALPRD